MAVLTIRALLADDQALIRMGFRLIRETEPDIEVVGEAADGATAVSMTSTPNIDIVLMDVRMPGTDGIAATAAITAEGLVSKVIILTTFDLDEYVFAGLKSGASGFLLKDTPSADLLTAIRSVAGGDAVLAPAATRRSSTSSRWSCSSSGVKPMRAAAPKRCDTAQAFITNCFAVPTWGRRLRVRRFPRSGPGWW